MNDQSHNQWAPPGGPPAGPPDFSMLNTDPAGAAGTVSQGEVTRGSKNLGRFGLAAALVVTAGVGGFAVNSALSEPSGAETPGEAFEAFFVAVDNEDLAGALELLPPGERESLVEPTAAVFAQLARLEVFDASADTSDLEGFDFTVEGVTYSVELLDPGLAWITTTGGTITTTDFDPDALPFGSAMRDWVDEVEAVSGDNGFDESVESVAGDVTDLGAEPFSLAVVEEDGSWHISVMYTMAESIRQESAKPFPGRGNGPIPVGGATPGEAMKGMTEAAIEFDLGGVISYLDPVEMAVLYDYAPLFLDDVDALAAEARSELGTITLDRLDTRSWDRNGRTMVGLDGFSGSYSGLDPLSGEAIVASVDFADGCYAITYNGDSERICLDELADGTDEQMAADYEAMFEELGLDLSAFDGITFPEQGVTVVERDGRWYLSIIPSMMYPMAEVLEQFEPEMLDQLTDAFGALAESTIAGEDLMPIPGFEDDMFEDDFFEDGFFDEDATTTNYVAAKVIPVGTAADDLLTQNYVTEIAVPSVDVTFESVWFLDMEIGGLVALRDIQPGETLLVEDFG